MNEEPGLIPTLRLFALIGWALLLLEALDGAGHYVTAQLALMTVALVLVQRRHIAPLIVWMTVGSIAAVVLGLSLDGPPVETTALMFWLFLPLVAISARYGLRSLLAFLVGSALLELTLSRGSIPPPVAWESVVIRTLLYLPTGFIIMRLMRAQRQARIQLAAAATIQEQLIVSQERNRMARDLHDTLAHTLSAVAVQLKALEVQMRSDPAAAQATLKRTQALTHDGLQETRSALHALRSDPVDDLGLRLALTHLAESAARRAGLRLELDLPETMPPIEATIQRNIYRVAEEALNNVVRHAMATTLIVRLDHALTIRDDGVGFDPAQNQPEGHYGLVGMRERATLCGGDLTVTSKPGAGTCVQLVWGGQS